MTQTAAIIILLYLVALFLTVATLWPLSSPTQTIFPKKTGPQSVWVLIVVVLPFVMLFYFGLAFLISDTISVRTGWLAAPGDELSFAESLLCRFIGVAMVALAQSDSAIHEDTRPDDNCDVDYLHNR